MLFNESKIIDSKINNAIKIGVIGLASSILLSACGNKNAENNKTISWQESSNMITLDSSKVNDTISAGTMNNSNEGLLVGSSDNKVIPGVAKNYHVSSDGKIYTFNLRHSKWSNGQPVTAKDFVYGWQRTLNPKTASQYSYIFNNVKNASQVNTGKAPLSSLGIKANGKYKLTINLNKPQSYFKYLLTMTPFEPQNEQTVKKYGSAYGTNSNKMIYNGPFKVTGWTGVNDSWNLVKNNEYWNAKNIKLNKIKFVVEKDANTGLNEYQTGDLDKTSLVGAQQVKQFAGTRDYHANKIGGTSYMEMNHAKNPMLRNINIRKAISMSISRNQLANHTLGDGSLPAKGIVTDNIGKHNGKSFADASYVKSGVEYDTHKAVKYWEKGMRQLGKKNANFSLITDDTANGKSTAEFIQEAVEKLPGASVSVQSIPKKSEIARSENGDFDFAIGGWFADFPDPISFMSLFKTGAVYNFGKFSNTQYDKLLDKAESVDANNGDKRWDDLVQAEKIIMNQQGIVPLTYVVQPMVIQPKVKNYELLPTGSPINFRNTFVNK
ncbi:peptide ABC transporter substrate-binding protein [Apilactobacillus apisilvae]|uniref:Peptide ABC transporter substrate-binding protein n=1 Tax=Apilactobacillus apisilvae TaxID=2923364 RepID=A0ABY4PIR0_9LACO|nr:peptide ABC transporter substrate-binding protein [Apilactobacillus apisilvae]UQS85684.1 peptide ABC transporter substrate-binding protein [Apilactobacillus apisilvae]